MQEIIREEEEEGLCLEAKAFTELTAEELYEILAARSAVFVVEQNCVYQDLDGRDQESLHLCLRREGRLLAYLRAFRRTERQVQIGRVLTLERGKGWGDFLMREGLPLIQEAFHPEELFLEAQCYARGFYERFGFAACSGEYLEDGIPHVQMRKIRNAKGENT